MRTKLLALGCVFACATVWAAPPTCVIGTLASYIRLGAEGCTFVGITFANFAYSADASGGARTVTAEKITVTPTLVVPEEARFSLSAPWDVGKGQALDSFIHYTAVLPCGDTRPALLDLALNHSVIEGITGAVSVDESANVGKLSVFDRCADSCQNKPDDSHQFTPVSVVLITDHVKLNGGMDGASLTGFWSGINLCIPCV